MLLFEAHKPKFSTEVFVPKQATSTVISQLSDSVQDKVHNLFSDGVVSASKIISRIFFSRYQLLRMEQLAVRTSANFINHLVSRTHPVGKSAVQCKHGKHGHAMCSQSNDTTRKKCFAQTHLGDSWLQVNHHASWHVLACPCLREEPSTLTSRK